MSIAKFLDLPSSVTEYVPTEKRVVYLNSLGRSSYGPSEECVFSLPANAGFLDCGNCYLTFEIENSDAALRSFVFDERAGWHQLINRVTVYGPSGNLVQEINEYHVLQTIKACLRSDSDNDSMGPKSGQGSSVLSIASGDSIVDTLGKKYIVEIPLDTLLGSNGPAKYFPIGALGGEMRVHIFFNSLNSGIIQVGMTEAKTVYKNVQMRLQYVNLPSQQQVSMLSQPVTLFYHGIQHQQTKFTTAADGETYTLNYVLRTPARRAKYLFVTHRLYPSAARSNSCQLELTPGFSFSLEIGGVKMPPTAISSDIELFNELVRISDGKSNHYAYAQVSSTTTQHVLKANNISENPATLAGAPDRYIIFGFSLEKFPGVMTAANMSNGTDVSLQEFQLQATYTSNSGFENKPVTLDTWLINENQLIIQNQMLDVVR